MDFLNLDSPFTTDISKLELVDYAICLTYALHKVKDWVKTTLQCKGLQGTSSNSIKLSSRVTWKPKLIFRLNNKSTEYTVFNII